MKRAGIGIACLTVGALVPNISMARIGSVGSDAASIAAKFTAAGYQVQIPRQPLLKPKHPSDFRSVIIRPQSTLALSQQLTRQLSSLDGQIAGGSEPETRQQAKQVISIVAKIGAVNNEFVTALIFRSQKELSQYINNNQKKASVQSPAINGNILKVGESTVSLKPVDRTVGLVVYATTVPVNSMTAEARTNLLLLSKIVAIARR